MTRPRHLCHPMNSTRAPPPAAVTLPAVPRSNDPRWVDADWDGEPARVRRGKGNFDRVHLHGLILYAPATSHRTEAIEVAMSQHLAQSNSCAYLDDAWLRISQRAFVSVTSSAASTGDLTSLLC